MPHDTLFLLLREALLLACERQLAGSRLWRRLFGPQLMLMQQRLKRGNNEALRLRLALNSISKSCLGLLREQQRRRKGFPSAMDFCRQKLGEDAETREGGRGGGGGSAPWRCPFPCAPRPD